MFKLVKED